VTPSRMNGPHDVSKYFDREARGFHLKEYTLHELLQLFRDVGFRRAEAYVSVGRRYFHVPMWPALAIEGFFSTLPHRLRRWLGTRRVVNKLLFISLRGVK
jgi:uncharacterized protein YjiS (DUF1127 family)